MDLSTVRQRLLDLLPNKATKREELFRKQFAADFETLFRQLIALYGQRWDFLYHLEDLFLTMWNSFSHRSDALLRHDHKWVPNWYNDNKLVGAVLYVDLFAGNIAGLRNRIDYLKDIGINVLHVMPPYKCPPGENDGGYAVSSYRALQENIGTIEDLEKLITGLHESGIYLVLDFILNHTSNEHEWALKVRQGSALHREYYYVFEEREEVDRYQRYLRDIFPVTRKGSFTYDEELKAWVWTTFNSFQWDLNYGNFSTFIAVCDEMLHLTNTGADLLRFDALPFIWKETGTGCENLPKAHVLIQAFRSVVGICAPSVSFLSEAIVHPDEVIKYISADECELSYNPLLMALSWESLATRKTGLLYASIPRRFAIPEDCCWLNYVRCHDDIGWTFCDEDAARLGINGFDHRGFLNDFYTGTFPGSFARGMKFQENPETGDTRIAGTCASLAGLETALEEENEELMDLAVGRILLLYSVAFSVGGIPLIYLGDELARLNNYRYSEVPAWKDDSRWIHRVPMDWTNLDRQKTQGPSGRVFEGLKRLVRLRKDLDVLRGTKTRFLDTYNPHLLVYSRIRENEQLTVIANFSENRIPLNFDYARAIIGGNSMFDLIGGEFLKEGQLIQPYRFLWIQNREKHG